MKAAHATSHNESTHKRRASCKATQPTGPDMLVKKRERARNMTGNNLQSLTWRHATRRAALSPQSSCWDNLTVQPARVGRKTRKVARRDELPDRSPDDDNKGAGHSNHNWQNNCSVQLARAAKIGHRRWPKATSSQAHARRKSFTCWFTAQHCGWTQGPRKLTHPSCSATASEIQQPRSGLMIPWRSTGVSSTHRFIHGLQRQ